MMPSWEKEKYRLHAKLPVHKRRLQRTCEIIKAALGEIAKPYAAISFGKDSMVMAHLLIQHMPDIPMVWSDRGEEAELPETYAYINEVKKKYNLNLEIVKPEISQFEIYRRYGLPDVDEGVTRAIVTQINIIRVFAKYTKENGNDGYFQGLRADESQGREKMARSYGPLFLRKKDNMIVCNPLLWWTGRDIWAYIVANEIPYHPEYDNDRFKNRELVRLSNWSGLYMARKGRVAELKYYHPELYRKLVKEFPEVSRLV